jgi:Ca-activated chloride channel family protein
MRLRRSWILVGLVLALPAIAGPAERAFQKGDLAKAKKLYEERLQREPADLKARYNLGNVQFRSKEMKDAEAAWQSSMKSKDPALRARAAHNLGNARLLGGDTEGAIDAYREALRAEPGSADTKYNLELALRLKQAQQQQQQQQQRQGKNPEQDPNRRQGQDPQKQQEQQQPDPRNQQEQKQPSPSEQDRKENESRMPAPEPGDYTQKEAERVLDGLKQEEKDLQADRMRTQGRNARVEKDW